MQIGRRSLFLSAPVRAFALEVVSLPATVYDRGTGHSWRISTSAWTTIGTAIEYAQRADTTIYSILFAGHRTLNKASGKRAMQRLARETGGGYFEVTSDNPIEKIYASIEQQLRNQYSMGYTPERKDGGIRYRPIRLTDMRC